MKLPLALTVFWLAGFTRLSAVILLGDGSPTANITAPTGDLADSGWQYEGEFGSFLGTAIAPNFFLTAKHIGGAGAFFRYQGVDYPLVRQYNDAFSDLSLWQISGGTLPSPAPLYAGPNETGQRLVVIGRGTQRGDEIIYNGTPRGWLWGATDHVQRWGENYVASIVQDGPANAYIFAAFDQGGTPNESHLSSGDSGGAVFIQDGGAWKLAAINYAVDDVYTDAAGNGGLAAAIYDAHDYYTQDGSNPPHYSLIPGPGPVPTGFYSTRVSSKLAWINSVIAPAGDADGNGISNRLDYAGLLNSPAPVGPGAPMVTLESGALALTYRKLTVPNSNLQYTLEASDDLVVWTPFTPNETPLASGDDVQTVMATAPAGPRFLRLRVGGF